MEFISKMFLWFIGGVEDKNVLEYFGIVNVMVGVVDYMKEVLDLEVVFFVGFVCVFDENFNSVNFDIGFIFVLVVGVLGVINCRKVCIF